MLKHKSLLEWSKSLGSSAVTKKGQIKAIRKYIKNIEPIINQFFRRKYYYRTFGRSIEYRATRRAEILGYPLKNPEYTSYSEAYKINTLIDKWNQTQAITLLDALNKSYTASWNGRFTTIKLDENYRAVVAWDTESDWDYYSKGYGRPKNTYSDRRVEIHHKFDGKILCDYVNTFQGEFLRKSLIYLAQKLDFPWLIEAVRDIPTKKQRKTIDLSIPQKCFKRVAVADGKFLSIFDGETEYKLGETIFDTLKKCPDYDSICGYGGIFVHATIEKAELQAYPAEAKLIDASRVTLLGEYWGKTNENGKIAAEYFKPLEIAQK